MPAGFPRSRSHARVRRDVSTERALVSRTLLRSLAIVGWDHLEAVVLAALAAEAPLLLIGPHGAAKSLLLVRLAEALGLACRHYNASILNFDDLVGFPVPNGRTLEYLQTPATIWDARPCSSTRCRAAGPTSRTSSSPWCTSAWSRASPSGSSATAGPP